MPSRAPQASPLRLALQLLAALAILAMTVIVRSVPGASAQTSSEGNVRLSPAMSTVPASDGPFTVYVVLEGLQHAGHVTYDDNRDGTPDRSTPSDGLGAFQFTIEYDPAIVEVQDVERGPNLSMTGRSFQCLPAKRDPGAITYGCLSPGSSPAGPQGSLTLASIQFSPRSNGLSPLVLSAEIAGPLGDSVAVDVGGGTVRVNGGSPAGGPTSATSTPKPPVNANTPTSTLPPQSATAAAHATATALGTSPVSGTPKGTKTEYVKVPQTTPGQPGQPFHKDDGSEANRIWLWAAVAAAALVCGGLALTAILWRRRGHGGL